MKHIIKVKTLHQQHMFSLPNYNPLTQTAAFHSLPNVPPFYPSLIIPESPSVATVFICLLFDCVSEWPLEWMTVVLLYGILNLLLLCLCCQIQVWVGASWQPKLSLVCLSLIDELCLCFPAFAPPPHLPSWCSCWVCVCLVWMHSHHSIALI